MFLKLSCFSLYMQWICKSILVLLLQDVINMQFRLIVVHVSHLFLNDLNVIYFNKCGLL